MLDPIGIMSKPPRFTLHKQRLTKINYFVPLDGKNSSTENEKLLTSKPVNMLFNVTYIPIKLHECEKWTLFRQQANSALRLATYIFNSETVRHHPTFIT